MSKQKDKRNLTSWYHLATTSALGCIYLVFATIEKRKLLVCWVIILGSLLFTVNIIPNSSAHYSLFLFNSNQRLLFNSNQKPFKSIKQIILLPSHHTWSKFRFLTRSTSLLWSGPSISPNSSPTKSLYHPCSHHVHTQPRPHCSLSKANLFLSQGHLLLLCREYSFFIPLPGLQPHLSHVAAPMLPEMQWTDPPDDLKQSFFLSPQVFSPPPVTLLILLY